MKEQLQLLRKPFPRSKISRLPKPTSAQTNEVKADYKKGIRCTECGGWHHRDTVHLDYVGHATVTDRLLDVDPLWNWFPMATTPEGLPMLDKDGGLWIKLTVCGFTRLGYGDADGKTGGNAMKEKIGDAIRNASMRFGVALDLWAKIDLHQEDDVKARKVSTKDTGVSIDAFKEKLSSATTLDELTKIWLSIEPKYKVQELINYAGEIKERVITVEEKINLCETFEQLTKVCELLSQEQQDTYQYLIADKNDEFQLRMNGEL